MIPYRCYCFSIQVFFLNLKDTTFQSNKFLNYFHIRSEAVIYFKSWWFLVQTHIGDEKILQKSNFGNKNGIMIISSFASGQSGSCLLLLNRSHQNFLWLMIFLSIFILQYLILFVIFFKMFVSLKMSSNCYILKSKHFELVKLYRKNILCSIKKKTLTIIL